jgi:hypothetical protein
MASQIPKYVKKEVGDGLKAQVWKVCLMSNAFVYDPAVHQYYTDLTNELPTGGQYTAGGAVITNKTGAYVDTNNYALDADDTTWTGATISFRYAIVYRTNDGKILKYIDPLIQKTVVSGTVVIKWNAGGIIKIK